MIQRKYLLFPDARMREPPSKLRFFISPIRLLSELFQYAYTGLHVSVMKKTIDINTQHHKLKVTPRSDRRR